MLKQLLRGIMGERRFNAVRSIRRIASRAERGTKFPWWAKVYGWQRGFRSRSVVMYGRAAIETGNYLTDEARDREGFRLNAVMAVFQSKLVNHRMFSAHGVRKPELVAMVWQYGAFVDLERDPIGMPTSDLVSRLLAEGGEYVWKPESAGGGKGISLISVRDGQLIARRGSATHPVDLSCGTGDVFLLERAIHQGAFWQSLWAGSVNTLRLCTMWVPGEDAPFVAYGVQRIGTASTVPTDNWSGGGLIAWIDDASGALSAALSMPFADGRARPACDVHPDSGARIEGMVVPRWAELKQFAIDTARHFPFQTYVGWDIAVDASGSMLVIEANNNPGLDGIQHHHGLLENPRVRRYFERVGVI